MNEGESAAIKAKGLRQQAAAARGEASRLTHEAAAWEAGAKGERQVAKALSTPPASRTLSSCTTACYAQAALKPTWITLSSPPPGFT